SQKAATSYNEGFSIRLSGELNVDALQEAIQMVAKRHSALHLRFGEDGDAQRVDPERPVAVDLLDFADRPTEESKVEFGAKIDSLMVTPFDLQNGPLLRTSIVKFAPNSHVLLWVADHIVYDGWSAVVVISEIRSAYNALLAGESVELPATDSFREYVSWEQDSIASDEGEEILKYWINQFSDLPAELELPTDFSRPVIRSYGGSSVHYEMKGELVNQVRELAKSSKTSTFVVMLAAFKAMLYKLSGHNDLVVGIHTAGQPLAGLDNLVGHAVSILPIRSRPDDQMTFTDFIGQVKDSFLDAQDHQPFTFGKLLQNLSIPRNPSRSPLVEVVFNLDKKVPEDDFVGLTQVIREIPKQATNWDLFLNLYEDGGTLKADFDYNTDLFKRETIQAWLENFTVMLSHILAGPTVTMGDVEFYPDMGLDPVMIGWNQTERSFPTDHTLLDIISRQAAQSPFKPAIIDRGSTYSYRDVDQRVNMLSRYFQTVGVSQGMLVGLCMERSIDMVISALAIMRAGAAYVPLDPDYPADRLRYMMEDSGMPLLVTKSEFTTIIPNMVRLIVLDEEEPSIVRESNAPVPNFARPNDAAYMIYTSGSSGQPKGVLVPHKALTNFLFSMQTEPGVMTGDVMVNVTTLSFDIAALELYLPLISGARLAIARPEIATDGTKLAEMLDEVEASIMQATPATWKLLLDAGWSGRPRLKMLCGGEPMSRQLADRLLEKGGELWNMYGPTETTIWSTIANIENNGQPITIGKPIANTQVYILNQQMRPVPIGVEGDLYIGGAGVSYGYHKRPELTAKAFVDNPFGEGKLYNTGDIAKFNDDGSIVCIGRSDNQIKLRGFRIELGEIEFALIKQAGISDAVVVLREDEPDDRRLVGYVTAAGDIDFNQIRENLRQHLPYYMIPSNFMVLGSFPLTPNGKVDRLRFPEPTADRDAVSTEMAQPSNQTEELIVTMWADVLKIDKEAIGIHDDFFELGGHSLLATRVISRIKKQFGQSLSLLTFFEGATVARLAEQIHLAANIGNGQNGYHPAEATLEDKKDDDVEEFII
ncbi:MAG: amino acid adenylation domain-containing protein, partial [Chloroflexota bacterium]